MTPNPTTLEADEKLVADLEDALRIMKVTAFVETIPSYALLEQATARLRELIKDVESNPLNDPDTVFMHKSVFEDMKAEIAGLRLPSAEAIAKKMCELEGVDPCAKQPLSNMQKWEFQMRYVESVLTAIQKIGEGGG